VDGTREEGVIKMKIHPSEENSIRRI